MKMDLLNRLHCPYSGSPFTVVATDDAPNGAIGYGVVSSEAGEFPIVDGILRLQVDEYRTPLVALIRERRFTQALMTALDEVPFQGKKGAAINFAARMAYKIGQPRAAEAVTGLKRGFYRELIKGDKTFVEVANRLGGGSLAHWQIYRFSMPTFLPVFPLLGLLKPGDRVLDFGSGTGQASFLMSRVAPDADITCADYSFASLYLSKKYFVPNADHVCLDGDYPLPFGNGEFSFVFSSDALHCIDSKLSLSAELMRTLNGTGTIVLPHLHNRLSKTSYGKSLSPSGYRALFRGLDARLFSEDSLVADYFQNDKLDLSAGWTEGEMQGAGEGLSLVATRDSSIFRRYDGLWDRYVESMRNPMLNPAYRAEPTAHGVWLRKQIGEPYCRTMKLNNGDTYLPEQLAADMPSLDSGSVRALRDTDRNAFRELSRKLVVIDVPECFA